MASITVTALRARWRGVDRWLSDGGGRGGGRLVARLTRDGALLYFQHFHDGKRRWWPLGPYDEAGIKGMNLTQARIRAGELAALYRSGLTDLHAHFAREREAQERAIREAEEARQRELEAAQHGTLKQMLDAYVAHLKRQGKITGKHVEGLFRRHVFEADPGLGAKKAAEVTVDEIVALVAKLTEAGKGRTAAILRSYLRAAYSLAIRSRTDPDAPLTMRSFGVVANPVADIGALSRYTRARDRVLSGPELVAYIARLEAVPPGPVRDSLLLGVYLGGQRPAQLLRARAVDVDLSGETITLRDPKGARQLPRQHVVPLVKEASDILSHRLKALKDGEPLFSTDGETYLRPETVSHEVADIVAEMVKAKEAREAFQLRDVRRTVETMLAALGVSSDVRAELQSHGLGGVQKRHYDHHKYMLEKKQALETWARHLKQLKTGETAKVVPMRPKRRERGARA
jgi:integrase